MPRDRPVRARRRTCASAVLGLIFILMYIEKLQPTVFTPLDDGTGVLLNLQTLLYYSLNKTGAAVWQQIEEKRALTLDEVVASTCERFEVTEEAARIDLRAFVEHLARFQMVQVHERA
jgi:hypothetical protein